jgi:hypothetical protein
VSRASALLSVLAADRKGGNEMVKQRFVTLFKPLTVTFAKVFGPILGYHLFGLGREYFQFLPLSLLELLMGTGGILLSLALVCALWACGEWQWSQLRWLRGFASELRRCSRDYWQPETVKTKEA